MAFTLLVRFEAKSERSTGLPYIPFQSALILSSPNAGIVPPGWDVSTLTPACQFQLVCQETSPISRDNGKRQRALRLYL